MAKRILVIPDVHGRTFWKEPVGKYINVVDRVVFLGDYLDPYPTEGMKSYYQVFSDRLPFTPNLSIIDLLMNLGPEAKDYLNKLT